MKISHCNQLLAISTLISGVIIFATLWHQYQNVENISRDHFKSRLLVQTTNHVFTMSHIWLTTQDLLFSGKQTYLANGISEQSTQLIQTLLTIKVKAIHTDTANLVQQLIDMVKENDAIVQSFTQLSTPNVKTWQNTVAKSDHVTTNFVGILEELSSRISNEDTLLSQKLTIASSNLTKLTWIIISLYIIFVLLMVTWFSKYIVKPIEKITAIAQRTNDHQHAIEFRQTHAPIEVIALSSAIQKFTQRITIEKEKLEQERINVLRANEKTNTIMDTIPCALLLLDEQGIIKECNNETKKMLSKSRNKIIDKSIGAFIPALFTLDGEFDKETALKSMEESLLSPKFEHPHIEFSGRKMLIKGSDHYLITISDINERKHSQKALSALNEQLVNAEKLASIGQLSAGIAHEINNPVGYIRSNLDILKDYIDPITSYLALTNPLEQTNDARALYEKEDLSYIIKDMTPLISSTLEGVERVSKIIKDLGSYAHVDDKEPEAIYIDDLIKQSLTLVANELKYKVEITTSLNANVKVVGFPQKLLQVFINMLVNASHAIEHQGHISIHSHANNNEVEISFEDNGSGIDQENLKHIFDPFFTTKPVGKGTGLGLHIVRSIIDDHQGRIDVSSTLDQGSKFAIYLPVFVTSEQLIQQSTIIETS